MQKKKIKLTILVNNLSFFCSHRLPIAEAAMRTSFHVVIGYGEQGGVDPNVLKKKGYNVMHVPIQRGSIKILNDLKSFFYIWRFFFKEKPDVVHLITIKPYLYGGIVARLIGVPSLVSAVAGLGTLFINKDLKNRLLKLLTYPMFNLAFNHPNQTIIFHNKDDAKEMIDWGVLKSDKIKIFRGSGVQLKNFITPKELDGVPIVCFVGRLLVEKGVYDFISAAELLIKKGIQAQFLLAGDVDTQNPTGLNSNDIKKIKKDGFVKILGYQKDIPKLFAMSHIICLPSYREGFPKALIEAAAASRAVITTDVPGCRDAIIPDKTGLLVPPRNINALANAIQDLIENSKKRENMGKEGRKLAEEEYSIENIKFIAKILNIFKK